MIASPDLPAWDYVVIGAGSAGCALAGRLSENPANRVLLVEAGGWDFSPYIHIPAAIIKAVGNPKLDWCYLAEPDPTRGGKIDLWPAGRVMGGGSSINGMLYVRGAAHDFDAWAAQGCDGWSAADVLPVFKRMETFTGGNSRVRGQDGPLHVSYLRSRHPLADVFIDAAQERGLARNPDYNGSDQEGVSLPQVTQKTGRRFSAAQAYIWPVRNRPNLEIWTNAQCLRLAFDGKRCTGARVRRGGAEIEVQARREVIVSAGAIASPKLLMLSGIGPAADLARHGIAPVADLKGVGANLREHAEGMVSVDVRERTYNVEINSPRIALHLLNWLLFRRGPATSPYPHAVAFFRSTPDKPKPDTQAMLGPYAFSFSEAGIVPYLKPAVSAAV
ncbi:MAG: GMC family oxidoreductase N-terminal domain-containing protein, partial [Rhodobacteraceae bacterium]|nr:GMC family oxidoreductase N-terminal domain-containing protein [Paracoccaceae bacterium]